MSEYGRDGHTDWALRTLKIRRLQEKVRMTRLERGMLTVQVLDQYPEMTISIFAGYINEHNEKEGNRERMTVQDLRECVREYRAYIKGGGTDEDIVRSNADIPTPDAP